MDTPLIAPGLQDITPRRITPIRKGASTLKKKTDYASKEGAVTLSKEDNSSTESVPCQSIEEILGYLPDCKMPKRFIRFLVKCYNTMQGRKKSETIKVIVSQAIKASKYVKSSRFKHALKKIIAQAESSKELADVLMVLNNLLLSNQNVKSHRKNPQLMKLYKRFTKIQRLLVEFNKDDNTYLDYITTLRKAKNLAETILKLRKQAIPSELSYYKPFKFNASRFPQFNKAIIKAYTPSKKSDCFKFPLYKDIEQCLRKCVMEKPIIITNFQMKCEVFKCLTSLCKIVTQRRQRDLYFIHSGYIEENPYDPIAKSSNTECANEVKFMTRQEDYDE